MAEIDYEKLFATLTSRYKGATPESLIRVLCPILIPIHSLDKTIIKLKNQSHYRASFSIKIDDLNDEIIIRGRTGKFVSQAYVENQGVWREIAKGRIIEVDRNTGIANGEVYSGGTKTDLSAALEELSENDYLEIDQYGASAKVLSGLVEYSLAKFARESGYKVLECPRIWLAIWVNITIMTLSLSGMVLLKKSK